MRIVVPHFFLQQNEDNDDESSTAVDCITNLHVLQASANTPAPTVAYRLGGGEDC